MASRNLELYVEKIGEDITLALNQYDMPVIVCHSNDHHLVSIRIGSKASTVYLRRLIRKYKLGLLSSDQLAEIVSQLEARAYDNEHTIQEDQRIAKWVTEKGETVIELYYGDKDDQRIIVSPEGVKNTQSESKRIFNHTENLKPYPELAEHGDTERLLKYLNMPSGDKPLLIIWIAYTLAHPKSAYTNYVILQLVGGQGTGKSTLCTIIQRLIDPSSIGLRTFPGNITDLAIAAQNSHLLMFDNLRSVGQDMSDKLCICSTGGSVPKRKLYSDGTEFVMKLHGAVILNAISPVVVEPDLADRTLTIELKQMAERKSQENLMAEFERDLPIIFRGILDFISKVLTVLPDIEVSAPSRMIEFSQWLAAYEQIEGKPKGLYQEVFLESQKDAKALGLHQVPLPSAILAFMEGRDEWQGTPAQLLFALEDATRSRAQNSREFPKNSISLSMKLKGLIEPLRQQNIQVTFGRDTERYISLKKLRN